MESRQRSQNKTPKSNRKLSGYMLFSREKREKLAKEGEKITIAELGREWSAMPDKTKQKFNQKAEKLNNENYQKEEVSESEQSVADSFNEKIKSYSKKNNNANNSKNITGSVSSKKFKDEKIEKYFSENEQKKHIDLNSSSKKKIIEDSDSRLDSESEAKEDNQSDSKTEKTEVTEADRLKKQKNGVSNIAKNKEKTNSSNDDNDKIIIENQNNISEEEEEDDSEKEKDEEAKEGKKYKEEETDDKNSENNNSSINNKNNKNKNKKNKNKISTSEALEKDEKLISDKITNSKILQDGMLYKKDRSSEATKTIKICAEICASWGFASKLGAFTRLAEELNKDFDINFTVKPMSGSKKEFYVYYGTDNDQKLSLVFSNRASNKETGTIVDKNLGDSIIKKICEIVKSDAY